ncbi:hypothetical protein EJ08DRAFT_204730 [Tothia fuscella]|uniref:Uncharacterized protein n=1 Tax=Tothia fuscella TaxID=1048955 RepID=A0A9P4NSP1_9PEZI|nr:hypothetical protein EJ08DRAFT_204730 [Tothia fuscella]
MGTGNQAAIIAGFTTSVHALLCSFVEIDRQDRQSWRTSPLRIYYIILIFEFQQLLPLQTCIRASLFISPACLHRNNNPL